MRLFHTPLFLAMSMALIALPAFATTTHTDNLLISQDQASNDFYIQLGSFSVKSNADRLRDSMQRKTHHPVTAERIRKYYVVKVGPMHSAADAIAVQKELTATTDQPTVAYTAAPAPAAIEAPSARALYKDGTLALASAPAADGNPFIAGFIGIQHPNTDSYFTVDNGSGYPPPYHLDHYSRVLHTTANAAIEAGYRWLHHQLWLPAYALSLRYEHTFNNDIGDQITQYSLSEFTNYTYQWNIASDIVLAIAKVNLVDWHHLMPYLSGGVGVAFNRASNYKEMALPGVTARYSPGYTDLTSTRFAYHVGAGLDWQVSRQFIVSLGYEFQDLGNVPSGYGVTRWSGARLVTHTYRTNTAMLGLNYLINTTPDVLA